jgi:hypothetical protein
MRRNKAKTARRPNPVFPPSVPVGALKIGRFLRIAFPIYQLAISGTNIPCGSRDQYSNMTDTGLWSLGRKPLFD